LNHTETKELSVEERVKLAKENEELEKQVVEETTE